MRAIFLILSLVSLASTAQVTKKTMTAADVASLQKKINTRPEVELLTVNVNNKSYSRPLDRFYKFVDSTNKIHPDTLKSRFIKLLNNYRLSKGITSKVIDASDLDSMAKFIVEYSINNSYKISHKTNIKGYETFEKRLKMFTKKSYTKAGENLLSNGLLYQVAYCMNISIEQALLMQWIDSPAHNSTLLIKSAKHIGFSYKTGICSVVIM